MSLALQLYCIWTTLQLLLICPSICSFYQFLNIWDFFSRIVRHRKLKLSSKMQDGTICLHVFQLHLFALSFQQQHRLQHLLLYWPCLYLHQPHMLWPDMLLHQPELLLHVHWPHLLLQCTPRPATPVTTPTTHNTRPPNGSISGLYCIYYTELQMPFSHMFQL